MIKIKQIEVDILNFCITPKSLKEIADHVCFGSRSYFSRKILRPLIKMGLLILTNPSKPSSPQQKYVTKNSKNA
jgi:ATP-dependent DNA helicase RecG